MERVGKIKIIFFCFVPFSSPTRHRR